MDLQKYQEKLWDFLKDPASYPHKPSNINVIQTHASVLAIVPPFVYKIKKQVDLGFMDFRSLEARKENCQKEIKLNSRLCPELYLDIIPISIDKENLQFGSEGMILDYALKMKHLPDGFFLDQLIRKKKAGTEVLDQILQILKDFYQKQPDDPALQDYGKPAHLKSITNENFQTLNDFIGETAEEILVDALKELTQQFLNKNEKLLEKRVSENKIKDCHGDLHLEHIHVYKNKICIYDCLEFSDRFRYTDIACDIAFLAMDLDFHLRPDLSQYVVQRFSNLMDDPELLMIIDFYKSYRACVRAKVESIKFRQTEVPEDQKEISKNKAEKYLGLALKYSVLGSSPSAIIVFGSIGSGKSTVAKKLSELLNLKVISSDVIRKKNEGLPLNIRTNVKKRKILYSNEKSEEVYITLLNQSLDHLRNNNSIVIDATFSSSSYRKMFFEKYKEAEIPFYFIELQATDETIKKRLAERDMNKEVISDARLEDFEKLKAAFEPFEEKSSINYFKVSSELPLKDSIKLIIREIGQRK